jgi:hypothetical protein
MMTSNHRKCWTTENSTDVKWYRHVVVSLQNVVGRFFYHHVMEGLVRLFMVEGLLRQYPDMKIAGMAQNDVLEQLGIVDRNSLSGCAQYLRASIISEKAVAKRLALLQISQSKLPTHECQLPVAFLRATLHFLRAHSNLCDMITTRMCARSFSCQCIVYYDSMGAYSAHFST